MKMLKWLLKISLTAVLISTLSIVTTGIVVNGYIQSVLASFNIELEGQPMGIGAIMKTGLGLNNSKEEERNQDRTANNDKVTGANGDSAQNLENEGEGNSASNEGNTPNSEVKETDSKGIDNSQSPENGGRNVEEGAPQPEDSLSVMGRSTGEANSIEDQQIVMSPDEMADKKSSLTTNEKEEIFTLLMNKLPQSEMQKISEAMEDGLTSTELNEVEKGISKYLSKSEFDKLVSLLQP